MGTLACRIELNKKGGVTITVRDADGSVVQTAKLDGESITFTCKKGEQSSTIVQKPDAVTVRCKHFAVDAETVKLESSKDATVTCGGKLVATSTGDLALESRAALDAKAGTDLTLRATDLKAQATAHATLAGAVTKLEGSQQLAASAPKVAIHADVRAELTGAAGVKVASDGTLDLEGTMTTLSGQVTNVKGTLVKLG